MRERSRGDGNDEEQQIKRRILFWWGEGQLARGSRKARKRIHVSE